MSVEEIEKLLSSYYEGQTSESEEALLRAYFTTHEVPAHLQADKEVFAALADCTTTVVPEILEARLEQAIDYRASKEKRRYLLPRNRRWISIAAGLALLIGVGFTFYQYNHSTPEDTFSDPLEARRALQAALLEVSNGLNDGMYQVEEVRQDIIDINQKIKQEIN